MPVDRQKINSLIRKGGAVDFDAEYFSRKSL
jgi:hypothetical protein